MEQIINTRLLIYSRNNKYRLKLTHWYAMSTDYTGELLPQAKEGIEQAVWLNEVQARKYLEQSYANIKKVFLND